MPNEKYLRLGELLIKESLLTQAQLEEALSIQRREGGRLGEVLVRLKMVTEDQMVKALGKQLGISYFPLGTGMLKPAADQELEQLIPKDFALKNLVLPLSRTLKSLTVAMADPLDLILIDNLKKLTGCAVNLIIATKSDITKAIGKYYGRTRMFEDAVEASYDVSQDTKDAAVKTRAEQELSLDNLIARAEEAPVIKLVDLIIRQAIDEHATDIHIEPFKDKTSLRYRIDGKLYEVPPPAKHLHLPIVSRIKILAKLDIAEKRLPQDGAFVVRFEERQIDIRVSTIPAIYGEKAVLRVLDRGNVALDLNKLGFDSGQLVKIRKQINSAYGLIFVTGPTGCGKTTTLYAMLNEIKNPQKNIITIEDPVEYKLDDINQVQAKIDIGLSFSAALRSFLRQDPDVILVGEVRDLETAEICMRAALTGHLVFSTLHTNDAPSAVNRLLDIGIEPHLITPSLTGVVAQRLARKLCPDCKEAYEPSPEQLGGIKLKAELVYKPKGCSKCGSMGYKGRISIAEVMLIDEPIRNLITKRASYQDIKSLAKKNGMQSIYESGIKKVEAGITSLEEILSVTLGE
ncbi:GspE/PulE family protein [Candidatus Omnitrophota bacterium]